MMSSSLEQNKYNIFITGAAGFIGCYLSNELAKDYNVIRLVSESGSLGAENSIAIDLRDKEKVQSYFNGYRVKGGIHTIIHLAGRLVSPGETEDLSVLFDNLKITESIVVIARLTKPRKIINFSSIAVYPNEDGTYNETSEVRTSANSDCLYGLSKFCSENILNFLLGKEDIVISHLRVSQVHGEGMRGDRTISVMLAELREKNTITVFGEGQRVSNFIEIGKLINVAKFFVKNDVKGIFNVGGESLSYLDLAKRLIKKFGDDKSKIVRKKEGSRSNFRLDTSKLEAIYKDL